MDIKEVFAQFAADACVLGVRELGSGNINKTYLVEGNEKKYVVQQINTNVFKSPDELMENVFAVTDYLRKIISENGGNPERETLRFIKTKDGKKYYRTPSGECFRAYAFVENSISFDSADTAELFAKSGAAFGRFQNMLRSFPVEMLYETIPHFHDTFYRYENEFLPALMSADEALLTECAAEIAFVQERRYDMRRFDALVKTGALPLRVTHNDTKLNNVMFDESTGECVCVIDLDTVMPGLALYDFGDAIRFGASTAAEDDADISKVSMNMEYFEAYARAYLAEAGGALNENEKDELAFSCYLMTLELAMRFLTDYLNGSVYFKTAYPKHNLVRAKNQIKLTCDIESKLDEMNEIIADLR